MKIVDLSRELYHRTPSYPGHPPVMHGVWKTHESRWPSPATCTDWHRCSSRWSTMPAPTSTRPLHFGRSGISIDKYPLEKCIVPGICLDLRHIAPRAEITPADLEAAVTKAGVPVPQGGTVLLCTGHHQRTFPRKEYSSDNSGVNVAATSGWRSRASCISALTRCGPGPEGDVNALVHKACLDLDITHIESLCNLGSVAWQGPVHVHWPADEMARRHGVPDPCVHRLRSPLKGRTGSNDAC